MLVDQPIPNLHGGVSQQSPQARFLNQVEEQINCIADPVKGLTKRPPFEHVSKLVSGSLATPPGFFKISRDTSNRFIGQVHDGVVRVWDIADGTERTVTDNTSSGNTYLNTATPASDIAALSVADYTYLVNKSVTAAKKPDLTPTRPNEGLIFVRAGNYDRVYTVSVIRKSDDVVLGVASYTTQDGSDPSHSSSIRTTTIAAQLLSALSPFVDVVERIGSTLYLSHSDDFTIAVEDDQGGQSMKAFKDNIQRFSDLPETAKEGVVLRIAGDNTSSFDDYYVKFNEGVWEETSKPGTASQLDPQTMPVALIRQPDNTFSLEELPWVDRAAGDDDSIPFPSFVGYKLNAMFYFRNRLGFLADENVILSKAGDYFNFFRTTATQLLDDDPIDTPASDNSGEESPVSILRHAAAFDKKLVLFSDSSQFILDSKGFLTPFETEVDAVTSFACSPDCRPVTAGRYIYFAFDRKGSTGMRQFYVDNAAQTEDAQEITAHVPTYLPANMVSLTGTTLENIILARSADEPSKLYNYEYFFNGQDQLQSAWGTWEMDTGNTLHFTAFFDNVAYAVFERSDGFHLEKCQLRPGLVDTDLDYFNMLDHRVSGITGSYDAINNRTDFTIPYDAPADITAFTLANDGVHAPGIEIEPSNIAANVVSLPGDVSTYNVVFGLKYSQFVRFSRPYYMQPSQNGLVANTQAVLKVRDFSVDFDKSGYFDMEFEPEARVGYVKSFTGQILGSSPTDTKPLEDGSFRIKTPTKNLYWGLTLTNDTPFPATLMSASWRGLVESKSQRV